jgi:ribonuclease Z
LKIRPFQLAQVDLGSFALAGYSVAGEESIILCPELDFVFDIGKCPREALTINHVLLTHGHMDHVAGLPYYFAQRFFQGMDTGVAVVPANLLDPLEQLMQAWGKVEGRVPPHTLVPARDGQDYELRRGLYARAFATRHVPGSLGFAVLEVRHKLKEEYLGLDGPQIVALKAQGVEISRRVEMPMVAYLGDTARANYAAIPAVAEARVLLLECTFFDSDHVDRARAGRHLHVRDLPEVLEGMHNERILLVHVTRRTNLTEARKILRKTLAKDVLQKVRFLMGRAHLETD